MRVLPAPRLRSNVIAVAETSSQCAPPAPCVPLDQSRTTKGASATTAHLHWPAFNRLMPLGSYWARRAKADGFEHGRERLCVKFRTSSFRAG